MQFLQLILSTVKFCAKCLKLRNKFVLWNESNVIMPKRCIMQKRYLKNMLKLWRLIFYIRKLTAAFHMQWINHSDFVTKMVEFGHMSKLGGIRQWTSAKLIIFWQKIPFDFNDERKNLTRKRYKLLWNRGECDMLD